MKLQAKWRIMGLVSLFISYALVTFRNIILYPGISKIAIVFYWFICILLLLVALYTALLDYRFTKLKYKIEQRDLFRENFLTEEFKKILKKADEKEAEDNPSEPD
ncbi:MAG: hypothetical protein ACOYI9_07200 [Candidatus Hydrogenedentales bacterium]|jgi:membrane protein YdbS with pleckstrin-like domain